MGKVGAGEHRSSGSLNVLSKTTRAEDEKEPKKQGLKLNVISGKNFGMTKAGTKIMSIISVAGAPGGQEPERAIRDYTGPPGHLCRLPEGEGSQTDESGRTLYRCPWPLPDSDERGWHQYLHESSHN